MSGRPTVWQWVVGPSARLQDEEARSRARLLGALTAVHLIAVVVGTLAADAFWRLKLGRSILWGPDGLILLGGTAAVAVAYALVRSGRPRAGLGLYLTASALFPLLVSFVGHPRHEVELLATAILPILIAGTLLSHWWVVALTAAIVACATAQLVLVGLLPGEAATGFAILVVLVAASGLLVVLRRHQIRIQDLHVRQLRDSEAAQRASEERLLALVGASLDIIVVLDRSGTRLAAYGAVEESTGYRLEDLRPQSHFDNMHPEDLPRVRQELAELIKNPGHVMRTQWRHRKKDGQYRWFECLATNRLHQPAVGGVVVNVRDISDRKATEEALQRSERRYRTLFRTVTDSILLFNREGRLLEVNDAACRSLGYTRDELLSMRIQDIVPLGDEQDLDRVNRLVIESGHLVFEAAQRRRDGSVFPVEVGASLTEVDGAPAFMGVSRDITDRRRAEAERERLQDQLQHAVKMESIGRLAGGVAHDFNNLLTAILGNVELAMRQSSAGRPIGDCLDEIRQAALSAAGVTRQLLTFSRKQVIEPRLVDVDEVIRRMHKMLERLIGEDVILRLLAGGGLGTVRVDPGLLEQAVVNLAVNARDAMPNGGVLAIETANVMLDETYKRTHPLVDVGPHVMLAVSDTGTGMSDEVKRHLFEPFFTTKPRGQGTGLGLATTYGTIRQCNGTIEAYSELGRGTTFKVYLPVVEGEAERLKTPPPEPLAVARGRGEVILVVEDDDRVRALAQQALTLCGYEVLVADHGEEALVLARGRRSPIHLLLTDVVMPGMNGREIARSLAQIHPETRTLFTSGYTANIIAHHGVLDEGIDFLSKPYALDVLARRVRDILDRP